MKYFLIHPGKLKVILSQEDLQDFSITYEDMDYRDKRTKEILIDLLERGKEETGFNPTRAKLYIEVYPSEKGGMAICFTALRTGQFPRIQGNCPTPVVFTFTDEDTLIECCCKAFTRYSHRIYKSSLYRLGEEYRLVVHPLDYADRLSVYFLLEYADLAGEGNVAGAYVEEHGKPIVLETALDEIARYFG